MYETSSNHFQKQSKLTMIDFEIQDKLGEGSFGTCFKVRRRITGEILVMKQIKF
jgi:hypothetical protein